MKKFPQIILIIVLALGVGYFLYSNNVDFSNHLSLTPPVGPSFALTAGEIHESSAWDMYKSDRFGVSFEYPSIFGPVSTTSFNLSVTQEELDTNMWVGEKVKAGEIVSVGHSIIFNENKCAPEAQCDLGIQIREFSNTTPYEYSCSEDGGCSAYSFFERRENITKKINFEKNGIGWFCTDGYGQMNVTRECIAYKNNREVSLQMGYRLSRYVNFEDVVGDIESEKFKMDDLLGFINNPQDFKLIEERYEHILSTINLY